LKASIFVCNLLLATCSTGKKKARTGGIDAGQGASERKSGRVERK
jgi:hypothetical protein